MPTNTKEYGLFSLSSKLLNSNKQYKTILISSVVTGKIAVRDMIAPDVGIMKRRSNI